MDKELDIKPGDRLIYVRRSHRAEFVVEVVHSREYRGRVEIGGGHQPLRLNDLRIPKSTVREALKSERVKLDTSKRHRP